MNPKKGEEESEFKSSDRKRKSFYKYLDVKKLSEEIYETMKIQKKYMDKWERGVRGVKQLPLNEFSKGENKEKITYPQDWSSYNKAQQNEKIYLMKFLDELLDYIPFLKKRKVGRKPISIRDKIFYLTLQAYDIKSSRRCIADLEIAKKLGFIDKAPHFNTVLKCLKDTTLITYLKHLINVSGLPLQQVETDFAVDSSGFSTSQFDRWFDVRIGKNSDKRRFKKVHLTCGTQTNIITAVNITKGYCADSPQFKSLILQTDRVYNIKEVSADKAYSSRQNMNIVASIGGVPFIPFKKMVKRKTQTYGSFIWKKMFKLFIDHQEEFMEHYHRRSNSETCFYMLKTKFGKHLRSKGETGQANEILAKCLAHNLCVLIQEMFELGIDLNFKKCAEIQIAHKYD